MFEVVQEKGIKRKINDGRPLQSVPILILIVTDKSGLLVRLHQDCSVKTSFERVERRRQKACIVPHRQCNIHKRIRKIRWLETFKHALHSTIIRLKGKVHPSTGHEGPDRKQAYSCTLPLTSALDGRGWSTPHPDRGQMVPIVYSETESSTNQNTNSLW